MFTKSRRLSFTADQVLGDTRILSGKPFEVDISRGGLVLELKSEGNFEWRETDYLILDMEFSASSRTFMNFAFYRGGDRKVNLDYSIIPNHRIKIAVPIKELKSDKWYLTPHPGNLKGHNHGTETHISKIDCVKIYTGNMRDGKSLTIYDAYLSEELPDFQVSGGVMVDRFGQNAATEFEGKFHEEKELVNYLREEYERAGKAGGYPNPDWDEYGGYTGLRFDRTGYFHTHFDGKRWWLVDPEGCAFLSNGVCYGSRMGVHGFVDGMENLFEWLPDRDDALFQDAWTTADNIPEFVKRNGEKAGRERWMFNFARANMIRAFGSRWWESWAVINSTRLKEWGFNTISVCVNNYFDERVYDYLKLAKIPYTWTLKNFPKTRHAIFRDFPDVFSPEYKEKSAEFARQLDPLSDDPYMIGYFINNEPEWLVEAHINVAERLLVSEEELYSKKEIVRFLERKYKSAEAFNVAWGFEVKDFTELLRPIDEERLKTPVIMADLKEFRDILISAYNEIPRNEVKKYAPNNMCLGMRYATIKEGDFAGSDFYDAFSFNCYRREPEELFAVANAGTRVPFMVGEWHYGASDTEYLCTALVTCPDEETRGKACSNYIKKAFSNPQLIGAHYFEYNDQPLLGRFDGEAMPHGLIAVTNRPHEVCLSYFKRANAQIYEIALGRDDLEVFQTEFTEPF